MYNHRALLLIIIVSSVSGRVVVQDNYIDGTRRTWELRNRQGVCEDGSGVPPEAHCMDFGTRSLIHGYISCT